MKNKVVLVTGASKGIGRATIIEFAKRGYNVVINYYKSINEANLLKQYVEDIYKIKAIIIKCDIKEELEVENMGTIIMKEFGRIDVLVNNASLTIDEEFNDKKVEDFKKVLDTNVIGTYLVSKYIGEQMLKQKQGKIINVSSTNGIDTLSPLTLEYDASKSAIISLTHNFSKQYAPYINVNCIAPGWTNTESVQEMNPKFLKEEENKILLKRFANPSEIAKVIVFLASEESSYINSSIIRVDGGY